MTMLSVQLVSDLVIDQIGTDNMLLGYFIKRGLYVQQLTHPRMVRKFVYEMHPYGCDTARTLLSLLSEQLHCY